VIPPDIYALADDRGPDPFAAGCEFCWWVAFAGAWRPAEYLADFHDELKHGGAPTAWVMPADEHERSQR
jgi:hypothetical protein